MINYDSYGVCISEKAIYSKSKNDLLKFIHCLWECKLHKPARITVAFNQAFKSLRSRLFLNCCEKYTDKQQ